MKRAVFLSCSFLVLWVACVNNGDLAGTTNTGNARICGKVVDHSGNGLPGADVVLRSIVITGSGDSTVIQKSTITDNSGNYVFSSAPESRYVLFCEDPQEELSAVYSYIEHDSDSTLIPDLVMNSTVTLSGRILADSASLPDIRVFIPGTGIESSLNPQGVYILSGAPSGQYDLCIVYNNIVNYLLLSIPGNSGDTIYIRDAALALDSGDAESRYSFYDCTAADAFGIRPVNYPADSVPEWYEGKDFSAVTYYRSEDNAFSEIVDTVSVYVRLTVYDTVTVMDTIVVYDTIFTSDTAPVYKIITLPAGPVLSKVKQSAGTQELRGSFYYDTIPVYDTLTVYDTVTYYDSVEVNETVWTYDTLGVDSSGNPLLLIDDFETVDTVTELSSRGFDSFWYHFAENSTVMTPAGSVANAVETGGIHGGFMHVRFDTDPQNNLPPSGLGFSLERDAYVDFTNLTAVSFIMKGRGTVRVSIVTKAIQDYPEGENWGHFCRELNIPSDWTRVRIPVEELSPESGSPPALDSLKWEAVRDSVFRVNFLTWVPAGDTVEVFLDEVYLEGIRPDDL